MHLKFWEICHMRNRKLLDSPTSLCNQMAVYTLEKCNKIENSYTQTKRLANFLPSM